MVLQNRSAGGQFQSHADWFKVDADGPLFDQRGAPAQRMVKEANRAMQSKVARAGQRHIRTIGASQFQYKVAPPTHRYVNNVEVERVSDQHLVHVNRVTYGNWIESGAGRSTRFKGYHLFRKAAQDVQARLGDILNDDERRLVRKLNGAGVQFGPRL